ncbi:cytochrome c [Pedobacter psychroterrae]|uniref:Cytochrome c n=2 Tax=Pedobacter psychroterrae TaxID=2530453 RepID=A0A4R0NTZ9_9SPHI|nr:cytochrome c [Pedobacter psychroterrae]
MKGSMLAMNKNKVVLASFCILASAVVFSACRDKQSTGLEYARNMYDPIAYNPDQPNKNFANGQTAQTPPKNTAPVGFVEDDIYPNTKEGYEAAGINLVNSLQLTEKNLLEGKHLFKVMCSPCHGMEGDGQGHLVKIEKFSGVPSFHDPEKASSRGGLMKDLSAGKIYHTIKYGVNMMGSYASQLTPEERWKVVLYVQELQKAK